MALSLVTMPNNALDPDELRLVAQAIEQVMQQLQQIEKGQDIQPMQYMARLCWETLYEPRELLRQKLPHPEDS